jgi:hypothetical protein
MAQQVSFHNILPLRQTPAQDPGPAFDILY